MPEQIPGKLEVQTSDATATTTVTIDGDYGSISAGGDVLVYDNTGKKKVRLGADSSISAQDDSAKTFLEISDFGSSPTGEGGSCGLWLGADKDSGGDKAGLMALRDKTGIASIYMNGKDRRILIRDGNDSIIVDGAHDAGNLVMRDVDGKDLIVAYADSGIIDLRDKAGEQSIRLDGRGHEVILRDRSITLNGDDPRVDVRGKAGEQSLALDGAGHEVILRDKSETASILVKGDGGLIDLKDKTGRDSISLDGGYKNIKFLDSFSGKLRISLQGTNSTIWLFDDAGNNSIFVNGTGRQVTLQDSRGITTITLDGNTGDISLNGADCAEEFDTLQSEGVEPGDVMIIEEDDKLRQSSESYDKRVVGVISGAGTCKPGIVLDRKYSQTNRKPVALMGKVYCKVDAQSSPVRVGDLLTTSSTPGHAMKASDPARAFGAVIGKALKPLLEGRKMIPVLVTLQ
jgi:hypothetical protein